MSRSNQTTNTNPCGKWFQWNSTAKTLTWYNKDLPKGEQNVPVELPFTFLVLDQLSTVSGFDETTDLGYYGNEVRNSQVDEITVRNKHGIVKKGIWKTELKGLSGIKFAKSVYIAYRESKDEPLRLGNIKFSGSALDTVSEKGVELAEATKGFQEEMYKRTGWFTFCSNNKDVDKIAVQLVSSLPDKKGTVKYNRPVFKRIDAVSEATDNEAIELDKELQIYLTAYLKNNNTSADNEFDQSRSEDDGYNPNVDMDNEPEEEPLW